MFDFVEVRGAEANAHRDALGELRIAVFREFPYLYDGDLEYERRYLRVYSDSKDSLVVLLYHSGNLVGATTCIPLADESEEFQKPFLDAGIDVRGILYFGESIVLPGFRGGGAGHQFFARRELHARSLGVGTVAFCAVDRLPDHPLRPPGYRPLDAFWTRMGFAKRDDLRCDVVWKDIDQSTASPKQLTFWLKSMIV